MFVVPVSFGTMAFLGLIGFSILGFAVLSELLRKPPASSRPDLRQRAPFTRSQRIFALAVPLVFWGSVIAVTYYVEGV
jgi:hypothetical protein